MELARLKVVIEADNRPAEAAIRSVETTARDTTGKVPGYYSDAAAGVRREGDKFGAAGKHLGDAAGDGIARGTRASAPKVRRALDSVNGVMRTGAGQLAGVFAGAFAASKIADFASESLDAAGSMTEATGKVEVVFGKSSDAVKEFATTSANAYRMSSLDAMKATGVYGNLLTALDVNETKAGDMSVALVKLAGDMSSFNDASPQETLDALRAGLTGETEPLKRFGVSLNEAAIQAQAVKDGLVETVVDMNAVKQAELSLSNARERAHKLAKDSKATDLDRRQAAMAVAIAEERLDKAQQGKVQKLTAAQKAQASFNAIMEQTKKQQGDAARTNDTATAKQAILTAKMTDTKIAIGNELMPVQQAFLDLMLTQVVPALRTATDWFKQNRDTIVEVGKVVLPVVGSLLALVAVTKAVTLAQTIWTGATQVWKGVQATATAAQWLFNAALTANPIGLVVVGIGALIAALVLFFTKTEVGRKLLGIFGRAFSNLWEKIQVGFQWLKDNWKTVLTILTGPVGLAVSFISSNFDKIVGFVQGLGQRITDGASGLWDGFTGLARGAFNAIATLWNNTLGKIEIHTPDIPGTDVGGIDWAMPKIPALATGGIVSRPTLALIGEAGPEAVVPLSRGRRPAGLGEQTFNLTINVTGQGTDAAMVRREARAAGQQLLRELRDAALAY